MSETHQLVVILPVPIWSLEGYIRDEDIPASISVMLYCDPEADLFRALNFNFRFDSRAPTRSIHSKTSVFGATWGGLLLGLRTGMQGDPRQQGGSFVIRKSVASTWTCIWAHYDRFNADQVEIPVFLLAAGLPPDIYNSHRETG
jgi:hypothetical protein